MARERESVGCSSVVSLLLVFCLLPFSCSSATEEGWLQYSLADGIPAEHQAVEVKELSLVREKREAPVSVSPAPANSSNENVTQAPSVAAVTPSSVPSITNSTTPPTVSTTTVQSPTPDDVMTATTQKGSQSTTLRPIIIRDNHNYYESIVIPGAVDDYLVTLDNPLTHDSLNSAHRLAGMIGLPFTFRFYGHSITNITIATGGFIYMSPFLHRFLASTQYIAPLMANFHTAASNDSNIYFQHVGDEFVIEWQNVMLKDEEEKGPFVFQAKLKIDGTITFVYKHLPIPVSNISGITHPVKIGLSDAFYNDTHIPEQGIIRRRIIEYHRVVIGVQQIEEGTVVILKPFPTCNTIEECETCARHEGVKFDCKWCSTVGRCSDGMDWYRQNWQQRGCKNTNGSCASKSEAKVAVAVTVSVLLLILLIAVGIWVYYAYTHPTSASGIWLMEHRPSAMRAKLANMSCCKKKPTASSKYAMESTA